MSLLISTSSHSSARLTVISFASTSGARAASIFAAMSPSWRWARCTVSRLATSIGWPVRMCEASAGSRVGFGAGEGADGPCLAPDLIGDGRS